MKSGIFAIVHIGAYRLYVGETHKLKPRWQKLMRQLNDGTMPSLKLQAAWNEVGDQRRFTFHTADEVLQDKELLGYSQFLTDTGRKWRYKSNRSDTGKALAG